MGVELGLPKERNYTEDTEKNKIELYIAKFYIVTYVFRKFFVLCSNTIKGKQLIVGMEFTQDVTEIIYIYRYLPLAY
jgi:hypothetical protein